MANNNRRNAVIIAGILLMITLAGIIVGLVKGYTTIEVEAEHQNEARVELKNEGCLPARENRTQLGVIEYRLESIDKRQEGFSIEQKAMRKDNAAAFKKILQRLPE